MDLFNIGTGELLVLGLLALALFGPEDMVRMARALGRYVRIARDYWTGLTCQLDREIALQEQRRRAQELDRLLRPDRTPPTEEDDPAG